MRRRHPPPLDARFEAAGPITAELLAIVARRPAELAADYPAAWLGAARLAADAGLVLVFDALVIGPPCPLLEAAHHVRQVRRDEHLGRFDDEDWCVADDDDDDDDTFAAAVVVPPTVVDRVLAAMAAGQEADRLVDGAVLARTVSRALDLHHERWVAFVDLALAMERLLVDLAGGVRIGRALVIDARLPGEQLEDGCRWAA